MHTTMDQSNFLVSQKKSMRLKFPPNSGRNALWNTQERGKEKDRTGKVKDHIIDRSFKVKETKTKLKTMTLLLMELKSYLKSNMSCMKCIWSFSSQCFDALNGWTRKLLITGQLLCPLRLKERPWQPASTEILSLWETYVKWYRIKPLHTQYYLYKTSLPLFAAIWYSVVKSVCLDKNKCTQQKATEGWTRFVRKLWNLFYKYPVISHEFSLALTDIAVVSPNSHQL